MADATTTLRATTLPRPFSTPIPSREQEPGPEEADAAADLYMKEARGIAI